MADDPDIEDYKERIRNASTDAERLEILYEYRLDYDRRVIEDAYSDLLPEGVRLEFDDRTD